MLTSYDRHVNFVRMDIEEYRKLASRTLRKDLTRQQVADNIFSGILGEAGEVMDLLKKEVFHGQVVPREKFVEELGDLLWYIALIPDDVECEPRNGDILAFEDFRMCHLNLLIASATDGHDRDCMLSLLKELVEEFFKFSMDEVMQVNIAKLERRYKDGFSTKAAVARADEAKFDLSKSEQRFLWDTLLEHAQHYKDATGDRANMLARLHASLAGKG